MIYHIIFQEASSNVGAAVGWILLTIGVNMQDGPAKES